MTQATEPEPIQRLRQIAMQYHADLAQRREEHVKTANALTMQMAEVEKALVASEPEKADGE